MKLPILISFLAIGTVCMSQVKFGVGYGSQFAGPRYYGIGDEGAYFRNKFAPSQQLKIFIEPFKMKDGSHFQIELNSNFLLNGYGSRSTWSWGDGGVNGHSGSTTTTCESAKYQNFQVGLSTGYIHYFGHKRNVKFGTGFFLNYARKFYEEFSNQMSTKRQHHTTVIYTGTSAGTYESSSVSSSESIRIPETAINFLSFHVPLGLQFSKSRLMELKLNLGFNYAFGSKITVFRMIEPSSAAAVLEFHYYLSPIRKS